MTEGTGRPTRWPSGPNRQVEETLSMYETFNPTPADRTGPRRFSFGPRGSILAAIAVTGAAMGLNWGWLTAVGAAPLILALAPCAVMYALGLCMKGGSKTCDNKTDPAALPGPSRD